jgi:hypothetical protein
VTSEKSAPESSSGASSLDVLKNMKPVTATSAAEMKSVTGR